jgi:NAD dependent epimerase/dehydratase
MTWAGTPVLVTGAGGFIGSHLAERLVREGATVRCLASYHSSGSAGWLDRSEVRDALEIVGGDLRDPDLVRRAVNGCDVVFHLGALIAIPYSYLAPLAYLQTNAAGTLNVLQAVRDAGVRRIVHTSTSEVYGTARAIPMAEAHPLQAQSPYAASKIAADKMAEAFHLSFGIPVVTVRPFNTYGPRQSARAVIPTIIAQALSGERISLGNTAPTRDFNFVADTVDGFVRAGACDEAVGHVLNLGTGREVSVGELARLIARICDVPYDVARDELRVRPPASEVERLCADSTKARSMLGWRPAVSLEDGLTRTIEWMRAHMASYQPEVYAI